MPHVYIRRKTELKKKLLYNKTPRGMQGKYIFLILVPGTIHILWVLVQDEAVLTCTHNLCFEQKYQSILLKIFIFYNFKIFVYCMDMFS